MRDNDHDTAMVATPKMLLGFRGRAETHADHRAEVNTATERIRSRP